MLLSTFFTYIFWSALNSIHKGTLCRPPEFSCCSAFSFMVLSPVNSKCLVLLLFIRYVMSDSLKSQGLQHTRLLCPPLSPGVCSNSRPLSLWCYLTISSSVALFSFCLSSFQASRYFPMSPLFISGGQSIGVSVSVLPMNIQGWFPLWLNDLNSLQYKGLSRIFSSKIQFSLVQLSSVSQSCLTLCNPMDCSTPGLPVHHQLSEFTQTHAHWSSDAIQPSYTLPSPSPPALNLSQHQGLFQRVSSLHQVTKVLEFQLQPSVLPKNILDWFPLRLTSLISLQSKELSRVFSSTNLKAPILRHSSFFRVQLSHP